MNRTVNKHFSVIIFLLFFFASLGFRIYWWTQKDGMHWDEPAGVMMIFNNYGYRAPLFVDTAYTGKQAKKVFFGTDGSLKSMFYDIVSLWKNKPDTNHGNLYHILQRIFFLGLETEDLKRMMVRGAILNLLLFSLSFYFFNKLMCLFFGDKKIFACVITFCTFLSTGTLAAVVLMRQYVFEETMLIITTYLFIKYLDIQKIEKPEKKVHIKLPLITGMSLITAFTFMSHYYSFIFVGFLGIYAIFYNLRKKRYLEIFSYFVILVLALFISRLLDFRFFWFLKTDYLLHRRYADVDTAGTFDLFNLVRTFVITPYYWYKYWWTLPVICVTATIILYTIISAKRKKTKKLKRTSAESERRLAINSPVVIVLLIAFAFTLVVMYKSPPGLKVIRYIIPAFSFFILLPAIFIDKIKNKRVYITSLVLLCTAMSAYSFKADNIPNLFHNKPDEYEFIAHPELPVIILNGGARSELIPYFEDTQKYIFLSDLLNLEKCIAEFIPANSNFYMVLPQEIVEHYKISVADITVNGYAVKKIFAAGFCKPDRNIPYYICYEMVYTP
ncbi:MAG: hypothetical protein Ta2B_04080 [Termitinemataceae bacterium]|nr:MAG: hypothetical protein Ta2B_04080 [Termitinemataceae bacterium]